MGIAYGQTAAKKLVTKLVNDQLDRNHNNTSLQYKGDDPSRKLPTKIEIYEAWNAYKIRASSTAKPSSIVESADQKQKRLKAAFGDNEHFNALGARWPLFS